MNKVGRIALALAASGLLLGTAQDGSALDASSTDASAIMRAVNEQLTPESALSRMKMTIRQGSSVRERVMVVRARRFEKGRKGLILIEAPADVRNTGFLTLDYKATDKGDEQWIYLPALHRVSRIPKSGTADSFVGSDFSISDLSGQDPDDYQVKILQQSVKVGDEECWLIESLPRNDEVKTRTGYVKAHFYISKAKQVPVQFKAWTVDAKKVKYFKASDIRKVDGLWTAHRLQMRTVQEGSEPSETVINVLTVKNHAPEVTDAEFTQQRLERGV